ncbi:MAG: phage protein Gp36 family protein [Brevinemataceae bacterium]
MNFCIKEDLFEACTFKAVIAWAKDTPNDSDEIIDQRIQSAINRAANEINLFIGRVFRLPLESVPPYLKDIAVKLSLYQLLSRRGIPESSADNVIRENRDYALKQLEMIAEGKLIANENAKPEYHYIASKFPPSPYLRR